jgi:hypothetical protein
MNGQIKEMTPMTFNPFEDSFQGLSGKATPGAKTLQDVLEWLERDECPLTEAARRTYAVL